MKNFEKASLRLEQSYMYIDLLRKGVSSTKAMDIVAAHYGVMSGEFSQTAYAIKDFSDFVGLGNRDGLKNRAMKERLQEVFTNVKPEEIIEFQEVPNEQGETSKGGRR